ncbi:MAG: hypothetical protein GC150_17675 [Rhizobiales bacterium]|nr:hypothetical protein [Hyphomicrobiales bacterium]
MNWRYGVSLGRDELSQWTLGGVSVVADLFKATAPFFIFWACAQRNWSVAFAASVLWTLCTAYSLTSGLGFAAVNRSDTTAARATIIEQHAGFAGRLREARQRLDALGTPRPVDAVAAALAGLRLDQKWQRTRQCTEATVAESRTFCRGYHETEGELARARAVATVRDEIAVLERQFEDVNAGAVNDADPQAGILARLTGVRQGTVSNALMVLLAVLVELGSSLGLFVALSHGGNRGGLHPLLGKLAKQKSRPDVARYAVARLRFRDGADLSLDAAFDDYSLWCARAGVGLPDQADFADALKLLGELVGIETREVAGTLRIANMEIESAGGFPD